MHPQEEQNMPAPPEVRKRLAPLAQAAIDALIDRVWEEAVEASAATLLAKVNTALGAPKTYSQGSFPLQVAVRPTTEMPTAAPPPGTVAIDESPQKRGARNRLGPGVVKNAVHRAIAVNPDGISREGIRAVASNFIGEQIKEGSLKQSLRLLAKAKQIENRNRLWFLKKNGDQHG